jgi:hypothetical protein
MKNVVYHLNCMLFLMSAQVLSQQEPSNNNAISPQNQPTSQTTSWLKNPIGALIGPESPSRSVVSWSDLASDLKPHQNKPKSFWRDPIGSLIGPGSYSRSLITWGDVGSAATSLLKKDIAIQWAIINSLLGTPLRYAGILATPEPPQIVGFANKTGLPLEIKTIIPCDDHSGRYHAQTYTLDTHGELQLIMLNNWFSEPPADELASQHLTHCFSNYGFSNAKPPAPVSWEISVAPSFCSANGFCPPPLQLDGNQLKAMRLYAEQHEIIKPPVSWGKTLNPGLLLGRGLKDLTSFLWNPALNLLRPPIQYVPAYSIDLYQDNLRVRIDTVPHHLDTSEKQELEQSLVL